MHIAGGIYLVFICGAGMLHWLCNGLPRDGLGFDSQWEWCINQVPCPLQGTVKGGLSLNDLAVNGTLSITNQLMPITGDIETCSSR